MSPPLSNSPNEALDDASQASDDAEALQDMSYFIQSFNEALQASHDPAQYEVDTPPPSPPPPSPSHYDQWLHLVNDLLYELPSFSEDSLPHLVEDGAIPVTLTTYIHLGGVFFPFTFHYYLVFVMDD